MYSCEVTIPTGTGKIRPVLNAGWSLQEGTQASSFFDAIYISKMSSNNFIENLHKGDVSETKNIILQDLSHNESSLPNMDNKYEKINPTLWKINDMRVSKPFILAFAEPYDPAWEARIYDEGKMVGAVKSVPLYGAINSFHVNKTGDIDIVIRYVRQDWFEVGLVISGVTIAFCIFYLFYDWIRNRISKKIQHKSIGNDERRLDR